MSGAFATDDDIVFSACEYSSEVEMLDAVHRALQGVDIVVDETFQFKTLVRLSAPSFHVVCLCLQKCAMVLHCMKWRAGGVQQTGEQVLCTLGTGSAPGYG